PATRGCGLSSFDQQLTQSGGDVPEALERVGVPMYLLDRDSRVTWMNRAAYEFVPTAIGRLASDVLTPDQVSEAKRQFALKILGQADATDYTTAFRTSEGGRIEVDISSVPLRDGNTIVGVFGVFRPHSDAIKAKAAEGAPALTPRQREVL